MTKSVKKKKAIKKIEKAVRRAVRKGIAEEDVEQAVDKAISKAPKVKVRPPKEGVKKTMKSAKKPTRVRMIEAKSRAPRAAKKADGELED
jgi:hypothetical protein